MRPLVKLYIYKLCVRSGIELDLNSLEYFGYKIIQNYNLIDDDQSNLLDISKLVIKDLESVQHNLLC